jgi:hypothetical protein
MTARILDVSEDEYFADPCERSSLSQSIAKTIVTESLLHAWQVHPKLGAQPRKPTDATNTGHIIHKLLLGKGAAVEVLNVKEYRSNADKALRDEALAAGRIPVKAHEYEKLQMAAESIRANLAIEGVSLRGESEVAFEFTDQGKNGPVLCRARMDHVVFEQGLIYDIKSISSAHPDQCAKHMTEYGYDIQHHVYTTRCLAQYLPERQGRIDMQFCFVEVEPPYAVTVARPSGAMRELGAARWERAKYRWERALETNHWPAYASGGAPVELEPSPWALSKELRNDW